MPYVVLLKYMRPVFQRVERVDYHTTLIYYISYSTLYCLTNWPACVLAGVALLAAHEDKAEEVPLAGDLHPVRQLVVQRLAVPVHKTSPSYSRKLSSGFSRIILDLWLECAENLDRVYSRDASYIIK